MKTKIEKLSWPDMYSILFITIPMLTPLYFNLVQVFPWYRSLYLTSLALFVVVGLLSISRLLHNLIDAINKEE